MEAATGQRYVHLFTAGQDGYYLARGMAVDRRGRSPRSRAGVMAKATHPRGARRSANSTWCSNSDSRACTRTSASAPRPHIGRVYAGDLPGLWFAGEANLGRLPGNDARGMVLRRARRERPSPAGAADVLVVGAGLAASPPDNGRSPPDAPYLSWSAHRAGGASSATRASASHFHWVPPGCTANRPPAHRIGVVCPDDWGAGFEFVVRPRPARRGSGGGVRPAAARGRNASLPPPDVNAEWALREAWLRRPTSTRSSPTWWRHGSRSRSRTSTGRRWTTCAGRRIRAVRAAG